MCHQRGRGSTIPRAFCVAAITLMDHHDLLRMMNMLRLRYASSI